jgi:CRISPR/Cas system-associated protein Csx1
MVVQVQLNEDVPPALPDVMSDIQSEKEELVEFTVIDAENSEPVEEVYQAEPLEIQRLEQKKAPELCMRVIVTKHGF